MQHFLVYQIKMNWTELCSWLSSSSTISQTNMCMYVCSYILHWCQCEVDKWSYSAGLILVSFLDPTNPSTDPDRFQYCVRGRRVWWLLSRFRVWIGMCNYYISRVNKQRNLDLTEGLALFVLIWPYLKSCCLPAPSVTAAISPFLNGLY